jgi:hypothetical protein
MPDAVADYITTTLASSPALAKVYGRVWHAFPHQLESTTPYPCVTFARPISGTAERFTPYQEEPLWIWVYSDQNQDEAWELASAVRSLLDCTNASAQGKSFIFHVDGTPVDSADQELTSGRRLYRVILFFTVQTLG